MPRRRSLAGDQIQLIVAVEVVLVGLAAEIDALQELVRNVWISGRSQEGRIPVEAGYDPVLDGTGLHLARPADDGRHPEATFRNSALGGLERRHATIGPSEHFRSVVGAEDDDGVVRFADVLDVLQER